MVSWQQSVGWRLDTWDIECYPWTTIASIVQKSDSVTTNPMLTLTPVLAKWPLDSRTFGLSNLWTIEQTPRWLTISVKPRLIMTRNVTVDELATWIYNSHSHSLYRSECVHKPAILGDFSEHVKLSGSSWNSVQHRGKMMLHRISWWL